MRRPCWYPSVWHSWSYMGRNNSNREWMASGLHPAKDTCGGLSPYQWTSLFVMWRTRWTKPTSIRRIDRIFLDFPSIEKWIEASGIKKHITFHCSRHTFATLQLEHDTDIYTIKGMLGHTNVKTTQIYAHIVDKSKRNAADVIHIDNLDAVDAPQKSIAAI